MLAEIITIGDELLIGQVVDTNSAWIAQQLNLCGVKVKQISSVSDDDTHILKALDEAAERADLILITGGLGPTKDDITKLTLCRYFGVGLRFDEGAYQDVERIFHARGIEVTPLNRKQAEVPENCTVIHNHQGTAPGMWFEKGEKVWVSMPGVPYEMKAMMTATVLPRIKQRFQLPVIVHKTVLTQGIGESFLSEIIENWENSLALHNIKLAYLPTVGKVRLRLSASGDNRQALEQQVEQKIKELQQLIPQYIYGYEVYGEETPTLQQLVGEELRRKKQTVSTVESCTGGYLAHLITGVAGSSDYYKGSVIAYKNEVKIKELKVNEQVIETYGVVSEQVVTAMAKGIREKLDTTYGIATSGIAGPDGGTAQTPVGTICIAVASAEKVSAQTFSFGKNRERNIIRAADTALEMLRKMINPNYAVEV